MKSPENQTPEEALSQSGASNESRGGTTQEPACATCRDPQAAHGEVGFCSSVG